MCGGVDGVCSVGGAVWWSEGTELDAWGWGGGGYVVMADGSEALNALRISCGSFPLIMSATALHRMSSRPLMSR